MDTHSHAYIYIHTHNSDSKSASQQVALGDNKVSYTIIVAGTCIYVFKIVKVIHVIIYKSLKLCPTEQLMET